MADRAAANERIDAVTCVLEDEQAAHQDTLRLWQEAKERIARLEGERRATMEVLHWAREYMDALCNGEEAAVQGGFLTKMSKAVDALDALPTPNTAGPNDHED